MRVVVEEEGCTEFIYTDAHTFSHTNVPVLIMGLMVGMVVEMVVRTAVVRAGLVIVRFSAALSVCGAKETK